MARYWALVTFTAAAAFILHFQNVQGNEEDAVKIKSCRCYACDLSEHANPSNLTITGRMDGSGATAQQALYAMAWAAQLRLRFGGVVMLGQHADVAHGGLCYPERKH
jgi:hypothetical protein